MTIRASADVSCEAMRPLLRHAAGIATGWLAGPSLREGRRITLVFRADPEGGQIHVALVAFGGQDWMTEGTSRKAFSEPGK